MAIVVIYLKINFSESSDAGKTTTTERMLFYSGVISSPGEVHKGSSINHN